MGEHVNGNGNGSGSVELTMGDRMNLVTFALAPEEGLVDAAGDRVSGAALSAVLRSIAGFADGYGVAFPSYGRLSGMTRLGRRTIQRAMECLEQAGILVLIGRKRRGDGTLGTAEWRLDWAALAAWVPENERRRIPQQVVDLIAMDHRPSAMVARGQGDNQAPPEAHPSATTGTHQAPSDGAAEPSGEPSENHHQSRSGEDAAGGGGDAPSAVWEAHRSESVCGETCPSPPQGGPSPSRGEGGDSGAGGPAEAEQSAGREETERAMVARGINPSVAAQLATELDLAAVRKAIGEAHAKSQSIELLVTRLRTLAAQRRAKRNEGEQSSTRSARRTRSGCVGVERSRIIRDLAAVIAATIARRAQLGKPVDQEAMFQVHRSHVESDARKCGVIDDVGFVQFWSEVWAAVVDGGEAFNAEGAESAEKSERRVG